jgi:hypothetical protein
MKITQEYKDPVKEEEAKQLPDKTEGQSVAKHNYYATDWADNAFTLHAGGGLNVRLNRAFELRVADLSYKQTGWADERSSVPERIQAQLGLRSADGDLVIRAPA